MEILKKIKNKLNYILTDFASWRLLNNNTRRDILNFVGAKISKNSEIGFGYNITIPDNLFVGQNVYISNYAYIGSEAKVVIEDYVRIGMQLVLLTQNNPYDYNNLPRRKVIAGEKINTVIAKGSALGARVTLLPGVNIAEGCVIAAGAVVTKSTEPNGLYAGVPAKRIKDLPVGDED